MENDISIAPSQKVGEKYKKIAFVSLVIVVFIVMAGAYYYTKLQTRIDSDKDVIDNLQQNLNGAKQKENEGAVAAAIPVYSKEEPLGGFVNFSYGGINFQIAQASKYWLKNPADSKEIPIPMTDSDGNMKNENFLIPKGKSIIALSAYITTNLTSYIPDNNPMRPIFTSPEIRAKFAEGSMDIIRTTPVTIPDHKTYLYKFLYYADYDADRTFIRYGNPEEGSLMIDFNM